MSRFYTLILTTFTHFLVAWSNGIGNSSFLGHFRFNHMSSFHSYTECPGYGLYFIGARIRTGNFLTEKYPIVTAIEFLCSDRIQTRDYAKPILLLERNTGKWGAFYECPRNLFVTGIKMHMEPLGSDDLISEADIEYLNPLFNVFGLGRSRYISGISLFCDFEPDYNWDYSMRVPIGHTRHWGLSLVCPDQSVGRSLHISKEILITSKDERVLPLSLDMRCAGLINPSLECSPRLTWERRNTTNCTDAITGFPVDFDAPNSTQFSKVVCSIPHIIGAGLNNEIGNIKEIMEAYSPVDLQAAYHIKRILQIKFTSQSILNTWKEKFKLSLSELFSALLFIKSHEAYHLRKRIINATLSNMTTYNLPKTSQIALRKNEKLRHALVVNQLVGYCGLYKVYFNIFQNNIETYSERMIDGINVKITFEKMVD